MRLFGLPLRGKGERFLYTFLRFLAVPLFGGLYRCRVEGGEHLPPSGPAMVITNHKSNADPVVAGMVLHRPLRYMAKKELFVNPLLKRFIEALGAFPIDRGAGDRGALLTSLEILRGDEVLLVFPEGTCQRDDKVHEFLPGAGMIALRSGVPVVPMAIDGTQRLLRGGRLRALVGPPIDFSDIEGRGSKAYHLAAHRMQAAVAELYARL